MTKLTWLAVDATKLKGVVAKVSWKRKRFEIDMRRLKESAGFDLRALALV